VAGAPAGPVARRAARRIGGRVVEHERFGTATVHADDVVFDVVSARTETYERPGALPAVRAGATIEADLARRDFTVNAIALSLDGGELAELPGARADLEARVLRVLHDRSFEDDPTRLVRLARYAARLGFAIEPDTDALAAAAVAGGATETVTGARLGHELRLLLRERQPAALLALERHGLGAALLGPAFRPSAERIEAALALCDRPVVALAACLIGARDLAARLDHLEFDAATRGIADHAAARAGELRAKLDAAAGPVDLWRALRREPPEAVAVAGALGDPAPAREWLDDVSRRRLAIDGNDLLAAGLTGPDIGAALDAAHEAMLRGAAPDRQSQLRAAGVRA
jgi:tRNA nucleotidyltransferase (CCA-adding enzyme)